MNLKAFSEHVNRPYRTVLEWRNSGKLVCTKVGRAWVVDVPGSIARLRSLGLAVGEEAQGANVAVVEDRHSQVSAKLRRETALADKAEIEVQQLRGELLPRDVVRAVVSMYMAEHKVRLEQLPASVSAHMASRLGCDHAQLENELDRAVKRHLEEIAKLRLRLPKSGKIERKRGPKPKK